MRLRAAYLFDGVLCAFDIGKAVTGNGQLNFSQFAMVFIASTHRVKDHPGLFVGYILTRMLLSSESMHWFKPWVVGGAFIFPFVPRGPRSVGKRSHPRDSLFSYRERVHTVKARREMCRPVWPPSRHQLPYQCPRQRERAYNQSIP